VSPENAGHPDKKRDGRTPSHNFRVPDEMWNPFVAGIEDRGDGSPSLVLREFISRYNRETKRRRNRGDLPGFENGT
jgi:hypothetical protein